MAGRDQHSPLHLADTFDVSIFQVSSSNRSVDVDDIDYCHMPTRSPAEEDAVFAALQPTLRAYYHIYRSAGIGSSSDELGILPRPEATYFEMVLRIDLLLLEHWYNRFGRGPARLQPPKLPKVTGWWGGWDKYEF